MILACRPLEEGYGIWVCWRYRQGDFYTALWLGVGKAMVYNGMGWNTSTVQCLNSTEDSCSCTRFSLSS